MICIHVSDHQINLKDDFTGSSLGSTCKCLPEGVEPGLQSSPHMLF